MSEWKEVYRRMVRRRERSKGRNGESDGHGNIRKREEPFIYNEFKLYSYKPGIIGVYHNLALSTYKR